MVVKTKRKVSRAEDEDGLPCNTSSEPPVKKKCILTGNDFVQALRGPEASEALKQWLYLISNRREQAQMDKELSAPKVQLSCEKTTVVHEEEKQGDSEKDASPQDIKEDEELVLDSHNIEDPESDESVKHIDSFLQSGGCTLDIVNTLPAPENAQVSQLRHVFRALTKVLLRISSDHHDKVTAAVEVCRDLITSYSKHINDMLKIQRSLRERILNLELLTAMVALDSKFAKEILSSISLEAEIVEQLTSLRSSIHVRIAYIKLLVALLIDADNSLIMAVVNKPWLLHSVMEGLQYDPSDIVVLLLMTIKRTILENKSVTKSAKQIIFNTDIIICLLHLYKWKGPQNRPKSLTFWAMKKLSAKPKLMAEVDSAEAEFVTSAVQELLILLLTDHRYGIIFRDTSVAHQSDRHNKMVSRVLQRIGHPWENPMVAGLVSKILAACPDSLRSTLAAIEPFIEPRSSTQWFHCVSFLKKVLEDQCPEEVLQRQISWLSTAQLGAAAIEMCTPVSIVRPLCLNDAEVLSSTDISVVKSTLDLLVTMLKKMQNFVEVVRRWAGNGILSYAQSTSFRRHVTEHLLKNMPKLKSIEKAWLLCSEKYLKSSDEELIENTSEEYLEILFLLLELLEMYQLLCPAALDPLRSSESDLKSSMTSTVLAATGSDIVSQLRNRVYQLLLDISDEFFCVENKEMKEPICLMVKDLLSSCPTVRNLALSVLQSLISKIGTLEGSPQEAGVWLSTFQETFIEKEESCGDVATIIVESMVRVCTSCSKYLDVLAKSEEKAGQLFNEDGEVSSLLIDAAALQELFDDAAENCDTIERPSHPLQLVVATLSPWLPAFLEVTKEFILNKKPKKKCKKVVEEFSSKLLLRLLFRLPYPASLIHLVMQSYLDIIPSELSDYLQSWLPGKDPMPIESKLLGENSLEGKLSFFLFFEEGSSAQNKTHKLFLSLALPLTEDELKGVSEMKKSETIAQIVQMVHFICFHLTQLAQLGKLTEDFAQKSQEILLSILEIIIHFDKIRSKGREQDLFSDCFKVILSHPLLLQQFNPMAKHSTESSVHLTKLTIALAKTASSCNALHCFLSPFKDKVLAPLKIALKKKKKPKEDPVYIVDAFPLNFQEISDLLHLISILPLSTMVVVNDKNSKLSHWWYLAAHLFTRASDLRIKGSTNVNDKMVLPSSIVSEVSKRLIELLSYENLDLTLLIEAFLSYLYSCPQQTIHIPDLLLTRLMSAKQVNFASSKFAVWLASCSESKNLLNGLKSATKDKTKIAENLHVILPVLHIASKMGEGNGLKKSIMMPVYEKINASIYDSVTSLTDHPEWLSSNVEIIVLLMKHFMKSDDRESLCKALEKKAPVLTQEKVYYLQLVSEILQKRPPQLVLLLLAWLAVFLKKHGSSVDQASPINLLCKEILKILKTETGETFAIVKESKVWQETLRLSLKFGLNIADSIKGEDEGNCDNGAKDTSCLLLQTLASLFTKMYTSEEEHEHIAMVHSMTLQHSAFLNIMMGNSPAKYELVQFLYALLVLSPKIMDGSHVPVLLSAYNASTSKNDRALLRILILFERSGIDLSHCRPYFWGRQGANHYSIWSHSSMNSRTLFQQPRPDQVLGLLDTNMVLKTISKYPLKSTLNVEDNTCEPVDGVYDPAFYLPLFIYLLSPESPVLTHMFVRSGALAITLSSLSSYDVAVRAAAYTALSRFVSHLQMARGRNKDLLLHFMSAIQRGMSVFEEENPRLPSIVTVFLAHCALELANPQSQLYRPLMNFVLAKPAMNLRTIPEFLPLLHSDQVEHMAHRHWILKVLCEGLRAPVDIVLSMEVVAFKLIPSFYSSCLSDFKSKMYILGCLQSAFSIQYGACCLVRDYSLFSWLHQAILSLNAENYTLISEMVSLLSTLWNTLSLPTEGQKDSETGRSVPHIENCASKVLRLLLALLPKLTHQIGVNTLSEYISVLCNLMTAATSKEISAFGFDTLKSLFEVFSMYCPNKRELYDLLELGCDFVDSDILSTHITTEEKNLRLKLRKMTMQWLTVNKK